MAKVKAVDRSGVYPVIEFVPIDQIQPNPYQPRQTIDPEALKQMAESIRMHNLLQYPVARRKDGHVQLGDGHMRWEAFKVLYASDEDLDAAQQWRSLPLTIRDLSDQEMADLALEANDQRTDLNPIERARAYQRYLADFGVTQDELATKRGISQGYLANTMRLLDLPEAVQALVISQGISAAHGRELLRLKDYPDILVGMATMAAENAMSVKDLMNQMDFKLREIWRPLEKSAWPTPLFDLANCEGCEHRSHLTMPGWGQRAYCTNPKCWNKLQGDFEAAQKGSNKKSIAKLIKDGTVVDLTKLDYGTYVELGMSEEIHEPEQCETCEHRKLGITHQGQMEARPYCLKPGCYRNKKGKSTRIRREKWTTEYNDMLDRTRGSIDVAQPYASGVCAMLISVFMDYADEKWLRTELNIDKGQGWKEIEGSLSAIPEHELRWLLVRMAMERLHRADSYHFRHDSLLPKIARILPDIVLPTKETQTHTKV